MSDQQMGKKETERIDLDYFIKAYEWTTGERLTEISSAECPDFICSLSSGENVGVELVRVMRDPEEAQFDKIINKKYEAEPQETLDRIFELIEKKDKSRSTNYGRWVDKTILVLSLFDCSFWSLRQFLTEDIQKDFAKHGFIEVWLADYTGKEAYRDIELFGLFPAKWWGYHQRKNPYRKPYG
jgi:hypothetical protein